MAATIQDVERALIAADAAEDTEAAQLLADEIRRYQQQFGEQPPTQPEERTQLPDIHMEAPPAAEPPDATLGESLQDIGIGFGQGFLNIVDSVITAFAGADSEASKTIDSWNEYLRDALSAEGKGDSARAQAILKEAEGKGFGEQVKLGLQAFAADPSGMISQAAGSIVPFLASNILTGGSTLALGALGTITGAGITKEAIYDATYQELLKLGATKEEADRVAGQAQAYDGKNLDNIIYGAGLGALASITGAERLGLSKKIAGNILARMGKGVLTETVPEAVQAGQEKVASNVALQREELPTAPESPFSGAVAQATAEGVTTAPLGATSGALQGRSDTVDETGANVTAEEDVTGQKREAAAARAARARGEDPESYVETDDDFVGPQPVPTGEGVSTPDGGARVGPTPTDATGPVDKGVAPVVPNAAVSGRGNRELDDSLAQAQAVEAELLAAQAELEEVETILGDVTAEDDVDANEVKDLNQSRSQLRKKIETLQNTLTDLTVKVQETPVTPVEPVTPPAEETPTEPVTPPAEETPTAPQTPKEGDTITTYLPNGEPKEVKVVAVSEAGSVLVEDENGKQSLIDNNMFGYDPNDSTNTVEFIQREDGTVPTYEQLTDEELEYAEQAAQRRYEEHKAAAEQGRASNPLNMLRELNAVKLEKKRRQKGEEPEPPKTAEDVKNELAKIQTEERRVGIRDDFLKMFNNSGYTVTPELEQGLADIRKNEGNEFADQLQAELNKIIEKRNKTSKQQITINQQNKVDPKQPAPIEVDDLLSSFNILLEKETNAVQAVGRAKGGTKRAANTAATKFNEVLRGFYGRDLTPDETIIAIDALQNGEPLPTVDDLTPAEVDAATPVNNEVTGLQNPNAPAKKPRVRTEEQKVEQDRKQRINRTLGKLGKFWDNQLPRLDSIKKRVDETGSPRLKQLVNRATSMNDLGTIAKMDEDSKAELLPIIRDVSAGRIKAIADLVRIRDNKNNPKKAIQQATRRLELGDFDQDEVAAAEKRAAANKDLESDYVSGEGALRSDVLNPALTDVTDEALGDVTTATGLIKRILETGTFFEKLLAKRLRKAVRKVKVVVVRTPEDVPINLRHHFQGKRPAPGLYDHMGTKTIYLNGINGTGLNNIIALHELVHAATQGIFITYDIELANGPVPEGDALTARQRGIIISILELMHNARDVYLAREAQGLTTVQEDTLYDVGAFEDINEFLAYGFAQPEMHQFLYSVPGQITKDGQRKLSLFGKLVEFIRKLWNIPDNQATALSDLIALGEDLIGSPYTDLSTIEAAQALRADKITASEKKIQKGREMEEMSKGIFKGWTRNKKRNEEALAHVRDNFYRFSMSALRKILRVATSDQLANWAKHFGLNGVYTANKIIQRQLVPARNRMLNQLGTDVDTWRRFNKKYPKLVEKFNDFLHQSTLDNFDVTLHASLDDALNADPVMQQLDQKMQDAVANGEPTSSIKGQIDTRTKEITALWNNWQDIKNGAGNIKVTRAKRDENGDRIKKADGKYETETVTMNHAQFMFELIRDRYQDWYSERRDALEYEVRDSGLEDGGLKEGDVGFDETDLGKALKYLREEIFARAEEVKLYFPLMRYGKYWVRTGHPKSRYRVFTMFENEAEQRAYIRNHTKKLSEDENQPYTEDELVDMNLLDHGSDIENMMAQFAVTPDDAGAQILNGMNQFIKKLAGESGPTTTSSGQSTAYSNPNKVTGEELEAIRGELNRLYMMTLPDRNIRKRFSRRKGTAGFSGDAIRGFVVTGMSNASQIPRIRYSTDLRNALGGDFEKIKTGSSEKRSRDYALWHEMQSRVLQQMQPKEGETEWDWFADKATQTAFFYMLTSMKAATIQFTQLPINGYFYLVSKYGFGKTSAIVSRYIATLPNKVGMSKVDPETNEVVTDWGAPSLGDSKYVKDRPWLREIYEFGHATGAFAENYSADLSGYAKGPSVDTMSRRATAGKIAYKMITGFFVGAERLSREAMFLSAAELEYNKAIAEGKSEQEAIEIAKQEAYKATDDAMFNYTQFNKPPIMKNNALLRMAFQYMTFVQQMTYYLVKNFYEQLPFIKGNDRKAEAAIQFWGTLGMVGIVFSGTTGLPLYSTVLGIWGMMDDPDDTDEEELKGLTQKDPGLTVGQKAVKQMDKRLYFETVIIPRLASQFADLVGVTSPEGKDRIARSIEYGLIPGLLNLDVAGSTSLANMFHFTDNFEGDPKVGIQQEVFQRLFGPSGSLLMTAFDAQRDFSEGQTLRGIEKLTPAFARGFIKQMRLSEEGFLTRKGVELDIIRGQKLALDFENDPVGATAQVLGFNRTELVQRQKNAFAKSKLSFKIGAQRREILDRINIAARRYVNDLSDMDKKRAFESAIEDAVLHNAKYWFLHGEVFGKKSGLLFTFDGIDTSIKKRIESNALSARLDGFVGDINLGWILKAAEK